MTKKKSKWITNPDMAGWYWWRKDMKSEPTEVSYLSNMDAMFANKTGYWYGPIEEPK